MRIHLVGLGLIGSSIGAGLRQAGHEVSGEDLDERRALRARQLGVIDEIGGRERAELCFVCTPAASVVESARALLSPPQQDSLVVTDVASVKRQIATELAHPRFVAGHPMAGSEQEGPDGAAPDLFVGATWVLTPGPETTEAAFSVVKGAVSELGAEVVVLPPERHDELVAVVSHVPHLTAATLMGLAASSPVDREALMRLAAGGFRDMTRIAAGSASIWPDICADNKEAILETLDRLQSELSRVRQIVWAEDREELSSLLESARAARRNLPARGSQPVESRELRVLVPDRPGVLAEVTAVAARLGVNIYDIEIAHSAEGTRGVLVLSLASEPLERLAEALRGAGFQVSSST